MRYLLDACLLSELVKVAPAPAVQDWLGKRQAAELFVSALTKGELHRGVAKLAPSKRRNELTTWLQTLETGFESRILPYTHATAHVWAEMCAQAEAEGLPMATLDSLIAATALAHGLSVVTRNVKDFSAARVGLVNPWPSELGSAGG